MSDDLLPTPDASDVNDLANEIDNFLQGGNDDPPPQDDPPKADDAPPAEDDDPLAVLDQDDTPQNQEEDDVPEDLPEDLSKQRAAYARLRKERKELKQKLEEAMGRPADIDLSKPETLPEKIRDEIESMRKKAFAFDVRSSAEYKAEVSQPQAEAMKEIGVLLKDYQIEDSALSDAFSRKSRKEYSDALADIASDMNNRDQALFYKAIDRIEQASRRKVELEDRAEQAASELAELADTRQLQQAQQFKDSTTREILPMLDKIGLKRPDLAPLVEEIRGEVADGVDALQNPKLAAFAAISASLFPKVIKLLSARDAEIKKLEETVNGMRSSTPGGRAAGGATPPGSKQPEIDPDEDVEGIANRLASFMSGGS